MQALVKLWLVVLVLYLGGLFSAVMKTWPTPAILEAYFYVADNRWDNPPSRLVTIDPATYEVKTVLDGNDYNFHTINRGKSQKFGDDLVVTSSKQRRVFEVDASGEVVFEFVNTYDNDDGLRALVSEAIALPVDYFKELPTCD